MIENQTADVGTGPDEQQLNVAHKVGGDEFSLLDSVAFLLRRRRPILAFAVFLPLAIGIVTLLMPRGWSATTSFMPQSAGDASLSQFSSLAGQLGFNLAASEAGQSPAFYASLIESREILSSVVADTFSVADTTGIFNFHPRTIRGTIAEVMQIGGNEETPAIRRAEAILWLQRKALAVSTDPETGLVQVTVTTPWPGFSAQIAARILKLVNQFNLGTRQSAAGAERRFIQGRVDSAAADLRAAEDALQAFLQSNRGFDNSPGLLFEHDRLQRAVSMRQQIYTSLMQSYEQAKIGEVRNTPVITVVEQPEAPVRPDDRHLLLKVLVGIIMGGVIGVVIGIVRDYEDRAGSRRGQLAEVVVLWEDAKHDLGRIGKMFRRRERKPGGGES